MARPAFKAVSLLLLSAPSIFAATFVVPSDEAMFRRADRVVLASPLASYTALTGADSSVETITTFSVEEVIYGPPTSTTLDVREPGGVLGTQRFLIPGVPRFVDGERYLLFLKRTTSGWSVLDLVLGKFSFQNDSGSELLVRDAGEINGWDADGSPHREPKRLAQEFLAFLRTEGEIRKKGAFPEPKRPTSTVLARLTSNAAVSGSQPRSWIPIINAAYSPTSYTFTVGASGLGGRWNLFPGAVTFYSVGTEPGAPGNGATAITTAFASWNNDPNSNVNYVYGGADTTGLHTSGLHAPDNENTIAFERDLSSWGVPPFQCTATSYNGTLGLGGITTTSGTHAGPAGETFNTTSEADVEMNRGIANCALLFNNGDFNSAVTHEVGHTLGFRHSDQTRADNPSIACSTDPSLECSDVAIMKSFVATGLNATLQPWDQHAVAALYPGAASALPAAPTGVTARATSPSQIFVTWNAVSDATSYQILRRSATSTFVVVGTSSTTSFTDTSVSANMAYLYRVRAVNSGGSSGDSNSDLATTVLFTDDPIVPRLTIIKAVHLAELRTAVNAVRGLAGLPAAGFTDAAARGVVVRAVHITELRAALDAALSALALPVGGYSPAPARFTLISAIHFQEFRDRVK